MNRFSGTSVDADSGDRLCVRIVEEVAQREGVDLTQLPTLAEAIDPDALADFVAHAAGPATVSFRYAGYVVEVSADRQIVISDGET